MQLVELRSLSKKRASTKMTLLGATDHQRRSSHRHRLRDHLRREVVQDHHRVDSWDILMDYLVLVLPSIIATLVAFTGIARRTAEKWPQTQR